METYREEICRKLRETAKECGQNKVNDAVIVGGYNLVSPVGGHQYIMCPTLGSFKLANVDWKVARVFENA